MNSPESYNDDFTVDVKQHLFLYLKSYGGFDIIIAPGEWGHGFDIKRGLSKRVFSPLKSYSKVIPGKLILEMGRSTFIMHEDNIL